MQLEICVDSVSDGLQAAQLGADRIELNMCLPVGGLSPSLGSVELLCAMVEVPVIAMLRPRVGGFCYETRELQSMERDLDHFLTAGVRGVACGCLTPELDIDVQKLNRLVSSAGAAEVVFHRAFDWTRDPRQALEQLIDAGVTRVLTSGQAPSAIAGAALIAELQQQAAGRIEILPGAGLRPDNVAEFLSVTGCDQVHASLGESVSDVGYPEPKMAAHQIDFVSADQLAPGSLRQLKTELLREMVETLQKRS